VSESLGVIALRLAGAEAEHVLGASERFVVGARVEVYRNLHHGKGPIHYWSARDAHAPRHVLGVVAHVVLEDAELRVQRAAWAKVLATGRRSVHAYAVGTLRAWDEDRSPPRPRDLVRFTYHAARGPYFHLADPSNPAVVERSALMWFDVDGAWMRLP
jgi:hypothetical protein